MTQTDELEHYAPSGVEENDKNLSEINAKYVVLLLCPLIDNKLGHNIVKVAEEITRCKYKKLTSNCFLQ